MQNKRRRSLSRDDNVRRSSRKRTKFDFVAAASGKNQCHDDLLDSDEKEEDEDDEKNEEEPGDESEMEELEKQFRKCHKKDHKNSKIVAENDKPLKMSKPGRLLKTPKPEKVYVRGPYKKKNKHLAVDTKKTKEFCKKKKYSKKPKKEPKVEKFDKIKIIKKEEGNSDEDLEPPVLQMEIYSNERLFLPLSPSEFDVRNEECVRHLNRQIKRTMKVVQTSVTKISTALLDSETIAPSPPPVLEKEAYQVPMEDQSLCCNFDITMTGLKKECNNTDVEERDWFPSMPSKTISAPSRCEQTVRKSNRVMRPSLKKLENAFTEDIIAPLLFNISIKPGTSKYPSGSAMNHGKATSKSIRLVNKNDQSENLPESRKKNISEENLKFKKRFSQFFDAQTSSSESSTSDKPCTSSNLEDSMIPLGTFLKNIVPRSLLSAPSLASKLDHSIDSTEDQLKTDEREEASQRQAATPNSTPELIQFYQYSNESEDVYDEESEKSLPPYLSPVHNQDQYVIKIEVEEADEEIIDVVGPFCFETTSTMFQPIISMDPQEKYEMQEISRDELKPCTALLRNQNSPEKDETVNESGTVRAAREKQYIEKHREISEKSLPSTPEKMVEAEEDSSELSVSPAHLPCDPAFYEDLKQSSEKTTEKDCEITKQDLQACSSHVPIPTNDIFVSNAVELINMDVTPMNSKVNESQQESQEALTKSRIAARMNLNQHQKVPTKLKISIGDVNELITSSNQAITTSQCTSKLEKSLLCTQKMSSLESDGSSKSFSCGVPQSQTSLPRQSQEGSKEKEAPIRHSKRIQDLAMKSSVFHQKNIADKYQNSFTTQLSSTSFMASDQCSAFPPTDVIGNSHGDYMDVDLAQFQIRKLLGRSEQPPKNYICEECGQKNTDLDALGLHREYHKKSNSEEKCFQCSECSFSVYTASCMAQHLKVHGIHMADDQMIKTLAKNVRLQKKGEGKEKMALLNRVNAVLKKPYKEPVRDKRKLPMSQKAKATHRAKQTSSSTSYNCDKCSFKCTSFNAIHEHCDRHGWNQLYLCKLCDYSDNSREVVHFHELNHHDMQGFTLNNFIRRSNSKLLNGFIENSLNENCAVKSSGIAQRSGGGAIKCVLCGYHSQVATQMGLHIQNNHINVPGINKVISDLYMDIIPENSTVVNIDDSN